MQQRWLAAVATVASTTAGEDPQYTLHVLAIPSRDHHEYIRLARDEIARLAKLNEFDLGWTRDPEKLERD